MSIRNLLNPRRQNLCTLALLSIQSILFLLSGSLNKVYAQYCIPAASNTTRYINNFSTTLGTTNISNLNSGFSTGGYGNFSATQIVTTTANGSFNFSISFDGTAAHALKIWVDWNHDNDFDDPGETVFTSTSSSGANSYTGTITVPATVTPMTTRMRAGSQRTPITPPTNACMTVTFGEYEDYGVTITGGSATTCAAPTAATATAVTATTASLNWTQTGTPTQWQIKYGPAGFNVNTAGTSIFTPVKPYTLNPPLTPSTAYSYYVRAVCGPGDTSAWSAVTNFTTTCVPPVITSKADSFSCGPGTVVLKAAASAGGNIKWYAALTGGAALFTGNVFTTPSLATTTTYYIAAASGTCESTPRLPVTATIRPLPTVNIGNDTTICPGITYTMDAGNPGAGYAWSTGASTQSITAGTPGNYSVVVTLNGCKSSDTRLVTPGLVPQNNLPATLDLCQGSTATLNAGNTGSSYIWSPGAATTQTIEVITGGIKSVAIKSTTGCVINSSTDVTMRPLPVVNLGRDTAFCQGNMILLDAGNPGAGFLWSTGAISQTLSVAMTGIYSVLVTDNYACKQSDTISIVVKANPSGTINAVYGDTATYTFNISNPRFISGYTWDFGDGSPRANGAQVQHRYTRNGIFTVSVKLAGDCNDSLLQSRTIDVFDGQGTGMDSREEAADLLLYPNPAKSEITVANKNAAWQPAVYRIINALGLTLQTGKMTGSIQRIPVTSLVPGVYFIHIVTSKGFFSRKFEVLK